MFCGFIHVNTKFLYLHLQGFIFALKCRIMINDDLNSFLKKATFWSVFFKCCTLILKRYVIVDCTSFCSHKLWLIFMNISNLTILWWNFIWHRLSQKLMFYFYEKVLNVYADFGYMQTKTPTKVFDLWVIRWSNWYRKESLV